VSSRKNEMYQSIKSNRSVLRTILLEFGKSVTKGLDVKFRFIYKELISTVVGCIQK